MKIRNRALLGLVGAIGLGTLLVSWASADGIPETNTLYYSGVLEDGGAFVDGTRNVVIRLFDDAMTGTERCVTNASGVGFEAGRFRVPLVEACVDAVRNEPDLWVEVQIGADAPFARTKLGAVPYAVEAERAQDAVRAEIAESAAGALDDRISSIEAALGRLSTTGNVLRINGIQICWGKTERVAVASGVAFVNQNVALPDGCRFADASGYSATASMNDNFGNGTGFAAYAYPIDEQTIQIRMAPQDRSSNGSGFAQASYVVLGPWR